MEEDSSKNCIPVLPVSGWGKFPSTNIPTAFCYGSIYDHLISTAHLMNSETSQADSTTTTDFQTEKPMKKGRMYFTSGHVTELNDARKENFYFVKAKVLASFTQNVRYCVSLTLDGDSAKVLDASCDCKASAMGRCSHVAGVLFAVEDYTILFGHDKPACTSQVCTWNVGRKRKNPQPAHSEPYSKKYAPDRIINHDPRAKDNRTDDANEEFINNFIKTLPECGSESVFNHLLEIHYANYDVDEDSLKDKVEWALTMQKENVNKPQMEPGTMDQSNCDAWFYARSRRITASVAKEVAGQKSNQSLFNFLNKHLWGLSKDINTQAILYGRKHEADAFDEYQSCSGERAKKTGFWTNPLYPGLGCSPDGLIFDNDDNMIGVIEIKCPFILKNLSPLDIDKLKPGQIKNLFYTVENGSICIKRTHKYFYQVQMQIAVCNVEFCDFIIWSPNGIVIKKIYRDRDFWDDLYPRLHNFYKNAMLPECFEMRVPRRLLPTYLHI